MIGCLDNICSWQYLNPLLLGNGNNLHPISRVYIIVQANICLPPLRLFKRKYCAQNWNNRRCHATCSQTLTCDLRRTQRRCMQPVQDTTAYTTEGLSVGLLETALPTRRWKGILWPVQANCYPGGHRLSAYMHTYTIYVQKPTYYIRTMHAYIHMQEYVRVYIVHLRIFCLPVSCANS
jgi:hypothetical protein